MLPGSYLFTLLRDFFRGWKVFIPVPRRGSRAYSSSSLLRARKMLIRMRCTWTLRLTSLGLGLVYFY